VRKLFLKAFGYFACIAWSSLASAVGFGGINVTSSLGQPLVAEIELVAVDKADKSSLNAHLASPDAFKGAGIDYPYSLPKLKFQVETHANGTLYVKATSDQAVNEPFVSLLLELTWSSGRLLREYTFLLDPPGFVAEQPPVAAVKPIEPAVVASPVAASEVVPVVPVAEAAPIPEPAPVPLTEAPSAPVSTEPVSVAASAVPAAETAATEAASAVPSEVTKTEEPKVEPLGKEERPVAEATAKKPVESNAVSNAPITVKSGDTLSKIANQTKSSDVSLERMLVALYRANAEEFDGHNMNRIKTGKILRLPEAGDLAKLQQAEAVKEVHAQVADWNAYRQKLAAANAPVAEQRPKQEVAGKISTAIADKAPAAKETAKEVLKLSKGDATGDKTATGGKAKSAQEKATAKEEDSIAKTKALKEAEDRTALLEKNVKDMQRLVELKNQAAKAGQDKKAAASAPASAIPLVASTVAAASSAGATSAVAQAKPKPKTAPPKEVPPPPSLLDDILDEPLYLGAGVAVLLGLAGGGFVFARRNKKGAKKKSEDIGGSTGRIAAPVQASPETGDFTHTITATPASSLDSDEVDPIGEADLFLNFGRDVQAEEVLKEALQKDPSNNPVKLKLLSIYAGRKDTKSFYVYAQEIKESQDGPSWQQAAAMGRELEPNNALYGGGAESAAVASTAAGEAAQPSVDFDLGFGGSEPSKPEPVLDVNKAIEQSSLAAEKTSIMSSAEMHAAQDSPMDFDVTGTHPGTRPLTSNDSNLDVPAMDFDVSGVNPTAAGGSSGKVGLDVPAMDFDVTGGKAITPAASVQAPSLNLDDLVFEVPSPTVPEPVPAAPKTSDAGMDFVIDFPSAKPAAVASSVPVKDVGLSDISLNLDDPTTASTTQGNESKDENWQEVATKLDLAKAYQEMGDQAGAREILEEVVRDGDATQRETAETLLKQLS
jgi:pilus assembly protein FimV